MGFVKEVLNRTEVMLLIFIALGLLLIVDSSFRVAIDYLLGIMMFFSIRPFFKNKIDLKTRYEPILFSVLLNYVLLSGAFLLVGTILFEPLSPHHIGFILLAIVPPAISIIPLCYATKCDPETADASLLVAFLLSLIIIPVVMYSIFNQVINIWILVRVLLIVMIIPAILAFLFRNVKSSIFDHTKLINNLCVGMVLLIAISLNRESFFILDFDMIKIYLGIFIAIFGCGLGVYYLSKKYFGAAMAIDFSLYASQKNEGTALAIAVVIFSPDTVVPVVIALVMQFLYFIVFKKYIISKIE